LPREVVADDTVEVKAIAIIPARLASTRLPRKILQDINGRSMLAHVYEAIRACRRVSDVIVATDSEEIARVCRENRWHVRMTSPEHRSGTDRVHEAAQSLDADVYVNVQGDEPLARSEHLDVLLTLMERQDVQVGTLKTLCPAEDIDNPNAIKVVTAFNGQALYFSRATVPFTAIARGGYVTTSTSVSTLTANRRWMPSTPGRSQNWSATNGWNSCASWITELRFT